MLPGHRVQGREGFVEQQEARIVQEHPGQPDPLRHTAGELARIELHAVGEADGRQQRVGARDFARGRRAREAGRQQDVVAHVPPRQEHRLLEHHADVPARADHRRAADPDGPALRPDQAGQELQHRGFAAARRPEDRHEGPLLHRQRQVLEDRGSRRPAIGEADGLKADMVGLGRGRHGSARACASRAARSKRAKPGTRAFEK